MAHTSPDGASRALLAGVEAAVLGFLCLVVPAIASYVATAAAPALGDATWLDAAAVGSAVWRLGHGGLVSLAGVTITLVPLGVTALAVGLEGMRPVVERFGLRFDGERVGRAIPAS